MTNGLNLPLIPGILERREVPYGNETYRVFKANPIFPFLWHLSLSASAMSLAIGALKNITPEEGDYIGMTGFGFDYTVRLPAARAVHDVMEGGPILGIELTLHWARTQGAQAGWAPELLHWIENIRWPEFLHFYDKYHAELRSNPHPAAGLARVIRDSYAHGAKITNSWRRDHEVSWQGVRITSEDHGKPLSDFIGGSDLIVLGLTLSTLVSTC